MSRAISTACGMVRSSTVWAEHFAVSSSLIFRFAILDFRFAIGRKSSAHIYLFFQSQIANLKSQIAKLMMKALYNRRVLVLAVITLMAFALRCYRLDAAGLSEDESHKMAAVRAYQHGD